MKKVFITAVFLMFAAAPVFSEEVNLTPINKFSGFNNNGIRSTYPHLSREVSASEIIEERNENEMLRPKSVREMGKITPSNSNKSTPMTYDQFPQNYDSSNTMMMMQGGMQNMFMGY